LSAFNVNLLSLPERLKALSGMANWLSAMKGATAGEDDERRPRRTETDEQIRNFSNIFLFLVHHMHPDQVAGEFQIRLRRVRLLAEIIAGG